MIEALRDRVVPEEPKPDCPYEVDDWTYQRWRERQNLRTLLTEQARIARES
jgi:hypothetical protein